MNRLLDEKYFVFDIIKDEYTPLNSYYQVLVFASKVPNGSIGNGVKDRRWQSKRWSVWAIFNSTTKIDHSLTFGPVLYIVYDLFMNAVNSKQIEKDLLKKETFIVDYERRSWMFYRLENDINYMGFRKGPVPFTGSRGHYSTYYRNVRTTQERKMNCAHPNFTRGKRRNIPTSYDDIGRSDKFIKHSWKKVKKKKQWM